MSDTHHEPVPLDAGASALLAAYRDETARSPAQVEAALAAVTARIPGPAGAASGASSGGVALKLALAVGVVGGGAWWFTRPPAPATAVAASPAAPAVKPAIPAEVAREQLPASPQPRAPAAPGARDSIEAAVPVSTPAVEGRASSTRPRSRASAVPTDSLAAELALLEQARRLLRAGDDAAALAAVQRHRSRHPASTLAPERDSTEITALCRLGRTDEARRAAASFAANHGRSTAGLLEACDGVTTQETP